ncbi:hypothetical protein ILYODFUR_031254 [Ilyodon furcidens]|uniref:Uncharacterized protein n=1 Tax=Ilyodon furcidens TaxID=33524 RepID=A0ABV0VIN6_9TELE
MDSGSSLQKTQLTAHYPAIKLAPAVFHMTGLVLKHPGNMLRYSECWQSAVFRAPSFETIKTGSLRSAHDQRLTNSTGRNRTSVGADAIGINKPLDQ